MSIKLEWVDVTATGDQYMAGFMGSVASVDKGANSDKWAAFINSSNGWLLKIYQRFDSAESAKRHVEQVLESLQVRK